MSDPARPSRARAGAADRACFARVARANAVLEDACPPASLQETLARMGALRALLPARAAPTSTHAGEDDLESHLAYLRRMRESSAGAIQAGTPGKSPIGPLADPHGDR